MDFSLREALHGQPINADTLEKLGEQVRACADGPASQTEGLAAESLC